MLVLIADDLNVNQALLAVIVKDMGHEAIFVDNGLQAVEAVKNHHPHIILMDVIMPVMNGLQAIKEIRQLPNEPWVPIIVTSSAVNPEDIVKGIDAGADDYLTIPFVSEVVQAKIRAMLRIKQLSEDNVTLLRERNTYFENLQIENDQHKQLKQSLDAAAIVVETNAAGLITYVNELFCEISGYSESELLGQNHRILNSGHHSQEFFKDLWSTISSGQIWFGDICNKAKDGQLYWVRTTIVPFIDSKSGKPTKFQAIRFDITKSKQYEAKLQELAHYDALTKLPNRTLFTTRYAQAINKVEHSPLVLAVCFIDLDYFKTINDTFGHDVGDKLLIHVSKRIEHCIRAEDTLSRQGGDEFALLLGGMATEEECKQLLNRVLLSVAEPYVIDENRIQISASAGLSIYSVGEEDMAVVLRQTDQAMYQAKLAGRNRYHLFNTADAKDHVDKHIRVQEVRQALANGELHLYFQPKVNMQTGTAFGVEALIRWIHPENGLIPPLDFLPAIEGTPVEIDVGNWVIKQALKQAEQWKVNGLELEVSINISCRHLMMAEFVSSLGQILALYPKIDPKYIQLEILESSVLSDVVVIGNIIEDCQNKFGIKVALDDFGTGYSSLTHLRNLPADTVKIDQSFVRNLLDAPNDYTIIDSVIRLSESFGREIIAEGVETTEQGVMLMIMGCNQAQGYGIARPMPAIDILNWFEAYIPDQEWLSCGTKSNTVKEQEIKIITLTTEQWINAIEHIVLADEATEYEVKRCHLGAWINRLKNEQVFNDKNITEIEHTHDVLFSLGEDVINELRSKNIALAKMKLKELRQSLASLQDVLQSSL